MFDFQLTHAEKSFGEISLLEKPKAEISITPKDLIPLLEDMVDDWDLLSKEIKWALIDLSDDIQSFV